MGFDTQAQVESLSTCHGANNDYGNGMNLPVSVLITSYNHGDYLRQTVESALAQTVPPHEVIVVDDGSADRSVDILKSIDHPALKVLEQPRNLGTSCATNRGLAAATGEVVALLGSDDLWVPEKTEKQLALFAQKPDVGAVFTHPALIDEHNTIYAQDAHPHYRHFIHGNTTRNAWLKALFERGSRFCAPSAMIRRSAIERTGLFDPALLQLQDYDYWVRMAMLGSEFHIIEEPLTHYRFPLGGNNLSASRAPTRRRDTIERVQVLKRFADLKNLADCQAIFPSLPYWNNAVSSLIPFYVAQGCLASPAPHAHAAGVEIILELLRQPELLDTLDAQHAVGTAALYACVAKHPLSVAIDNRFMQRAKRALLPLIPAAIQRQLLLRKRA